MFAAILDPFHRSLQQQSGQRDRDFLGIEDELGAKAAAHIGRDDAQPVFVEAQQIEQIALGGVRRLRRGPDRHLVVEFVIVRDDAASLEAVRHAAMLRKRFGKDMRGAGESRIHVAVVEIELRAQIVRRG